jgi:hypothetical protein
MHVAREGEIGNLYKIMFENLRDILEDVINVKKGKDITVTGRGGP